MILAPLVLACTLGACASDESAGVRATDRAAERQATFERWVGCVERQSELAILSDQNEVAMLTEVGAEPDGGCEGHRRDVLLAFPPHMEPRLESLMDERTDLLLRTRLREQGAPRSVGDPVLRRALDAFSAG